MRLSEMKQLVAFARKNGCKCDPDFQGAYPFLTIAHDSACPRIKEGRTDVIERHRSSGSILHRAIF